MAGPERPPWRIADSYRPHHRRATRHRRGARRGQVRLRSTHRRAARARPLYLPNTTERAQLSERPRSAGLRRRLCSRSGRGRRPGHSHATRGYRSIPITRMEARLAHHARSQSALSPRSLSGKQQTRARSARSQHARQGSAADRCHRNQYDRRRPYASTPIRERRSRLRLIAR